MAMKRTHKDTPIPVGRLQFSSSMYKETMEEKLTDNIEDYDENIPPRGDWKRYNVDTIKSMFCEWIDDNIENEYKSYPNLFIKDEEKRFYMRIIEKGYSDDDPEDDGYYCLFVPFSTSQVEEV